MEIFVNDIRVPFFDDISLKFSNPLFSNTGSYSFPVTFPATVPEVQKAFGFPSVQEAESLPSIPARIRAKHINITGYWKVINAGQRVIEAYFMGNNSAFYELIKNKYLTDLTYAGLTRPVGFAATREAVLAYMSTLITSTYPDSDYTAYCAWMPNAMGDDTDPDIQFVNPCVGAINPAFILPTSGKLNSTVYLFVGAVLDYIFSEHGYNVERSVFQTDPDLKRLTIFNNFNRNAYWEFDYRQLVPRRLVSEFLQKISATFNIGFYIDNERRNVTIDFFDSNVIRLQDTDLQLVNKTSDPTRPAGLRITTEQVDEFTANDFKKISDFPGNPETAITIGTIRDVDPASIAPGTLYFVKNEETYYIVRQLTASTREMQRICADQLPYIVGDGSESLDEAAGSPGMYNHVEELTFTYSGTDYTVERAWLLPRCDLKSNYRPSGFWWLTREVEDYNDFPIMFLFARGRDWTYLEEATGSPYFPFAYPLGSPGIYGCDGYIRPGAGLSLNWRSDYGLYKKLWENRLTWETERKKTITADIIGGDIVKLFDFTRALNIEKNNYLVSSFTLELSKDSIQISDAELLRL